MTVQLAAPGGNPFCQTNAEIFSTVRVGLWAYGNYEHHFGTSMASAYVAGAAALLFSARASPNLNADDVWNLIAGNTVPALAGFSLTRKTVNGALSVGKSGQMISCQPVAQTNLVVADANGNPVQGPN